MTPIIIGIVVLTLVGAGVYYYVKSKKSPPTCTENEVLAEDGSCVPKVPGCLTEGKMGFDLNSDANFHDPILCGDDIKIGCMDIYAPNHMPGANTEGPCDTIVEGCRDPDAQNYNPQATVNNMLQDVCTPHVIGCMEDDAPNFSSAATKQLADSCDPIVEGCRDPNADNYNPQATVNNLKQNDCEYKRAGCKNDTNATNYNPDANTDDGSCYVEGCTDSTADNYVAGAYGANNPKANDCEYRGCMDVDASNYKEKYNVNVPEDCEYNPAELQFANLQCPRWAADPTAVQNGASLCPEETNSYIDEIEKASGYKVHRPEEGKMYLCPGAIHAEYERYRGRYWYDMRNVVHNRDWQYDHMLTDCDANGENCTARPVYNEPSADSECAQNGQTCGLQSDGTITKCVNGVCRRVTRDFSVGYNLEAHLKPDENVPASAFLVDDAIEFCNNRADCTGFVWNDDGNEFRLQTCKSNNLTIENNDFFTQEWGGPKTRIAPGGFENDGRRGDSVYFEKPKV